MVSIDDLLVELDNDSKIDYTNLEAEILKVPKLQSKWLKYHWDYKKASIRGESILANKIVDAQIFYSGQATSDEYKNHYRAHIKAKNSTEMSNLIDADSKLCDYREKLDTAREGMEICKSFLESLKYRPNSLKTILDLRIFESGG